MIVLITGVYGFLGTVLAKKLSESFDVKGLYKTASETSLPENIICYDNLDTVDFVPDVIVMCHAAVSSGNTALTTDVLYEGNVAATEKITSRFPNAKHLYLSSTSVYDPSTEMIFENSPVNPVSEYAATKYAGEAIVLRCRKAIIVRLSSLFGIGMKENTLIPNYINQALTTGQIDVWGDGTRKQNYFAVDDAVTLIEAVIKRDLWNGDIFLGTANREYANVDIAEIVASETSARIIFKNSDSSFSVRYDNTFTQNSLNWKPEIDIPNAITEYIAWKKRQF